MDVNKFFTIYSISLVVLLAIILEIGRYDTNLIFRDKQGKDEQFDEHKTAFIIGLVFFSILIITGLFFIFKGCINIQHDTSRTYKLVLLCFLYGFIGFAAVIFTLIQALYDEDWSGAICIKKTANKRIQRLINLTRSDGYYPKNDDDTSDCLMTEWSLSHLIMYIIFGFMVPSQWLLLILIGVLWEGYEYLLNISDGLDIFYNIVGLVIGMTLRYGVYDMLIPAKN